MEKIILDNIKYKLHSNYKEGFDLDELKERYTDYFHNFDYVIGDWAYGKLRLKGFYKPDNKKVSKINNFKDYKEYLKKNCAYECSYFILEKVIE